jgi:hypothetical protein
METLVAESLDDTDDRLIVKITVRLSDAAGQMFLEPQPRRSG